MIRFIVVLAVSIGFCFQISCVPPRGDSGVYGLHPALETPVTTPVFCVYKHNSDYKDTTSDTDDLDRIRRIEVQLNTWYSELPPGRSKDVIDWLIEYEPESSAHTASPVTAIEYGTAPPGYKEKHPALPLIPEKVYIAYVWGMSYYSPSRPIRFVIRADESGKPVKLEYVFKRYFYD
ncbi:MAG: hypothetical protein OXP71_05085 [Candidatus Poribacteria bacterium]|nr:hypothetical protein [Candidatus Poribacteria bacterium]